MPDVCRPPTNFYLLEVAFRSYFSVFATHILAGEVDTAFCEGSILDRIWWLLRYFNPVNLSWRYYSILAYRFMTGKLDRKKLALINFDSYPYRAPIPFVVGEKIEDYVVRRLEVSGVFSSQGLLSVIAAYQGYLAIQFTISTSGFGYLPNISKAMAILGLMRVMVSHWIASKIYVEPHSYPSHAEDQIEYKANRYVAGAWFSTLLGLFLLSMRSYIPFPPSSVPTHLIDRSIEFFYNYICLSGLIFHAVFLSYGATGLANRHLLFDHWLYKLQTVVFILLLVGTTIIGIADFIHHNYYRHCF
eukprot:c26002_g1_i1 orf=638-1543(-)